MLTGELVGTRLNNFNDLRFPIIVSICIYDVDFTSDSVTDNFGSVDVWPTENQFLTPSVVQQLPPAVASGVDAPIANEGPSQDTEFLLGPPEPKRRRPNTTPVVSTMHPVSELTQKYQGAMFFCKSEYS